VPRIFGSKTEEITGNWGKVHNGELWNIFSCTDGVGIPVLRLLE
jgi:hypothetical protein